MGVIISFVLNYLGHNNVIMCTSKVLNIKLRFKTLDIMIRKLLPSMDV
jgi:hypothetical protein